MLGRHPPLPNVVEVPVKSKLAVPYCAELNLADPSVAQWKRTLCGMLVVEIN